METVDFSPRMPGVEEFFEEAAVAGAKEMALDRAKRQLVIITPGRNVRKSTTLPPPEELAPGNRNILERIASSEHPQFIAAIGMTEVSAFQANPYRAVPFLGVLEGLVQIGHAVLLFEGHSSVLNMVCRGTDLLLVDEAMIPFLQADWMAVAESGMNFPCILKIKRGENGFGGAQWLDNPLKRRESALAMLDAFNRDIVLPALQEMQTTLERKGNKFWIFPNRPTDNASVERMFSLMFPKPVFADELQTDYPSLDLIRRGEGRYIGFSFAVEDNESHMDPNAGKFLETIELRLGINGDIYASPTVIYFMRFNSKFHIFQHRFKEEIEFHRIINITKYDIQNHFLNAWTFYKMNANQDKAPW